jgi:hypothetical protein
MRVGHRCRLFAVQVPRANLIDLEVTMNKALCVSAALAMALSGAAFAGGGKHSTSPRASAGSDTSVQIGAGDSHIGAGVSTDIGVGASSDRSGMGSVQGGSESSLQLDTGSTSVSAGGELGGSVSGGIAEDFRSPRD